MIKVDEHTQHELYKDKVVFGYLKLERSQINIILHDGDVVYYDTNQSLPLPSAQADRLTRHLGVENPSFKVFEKEIQVRILSKQGFELFAVNSISDVHAHIKTHSSKIVERQVFLLSRVKALEESLITASSIERRKIIRAINRTQHRAYRTACWLK